MGNVKVQAIIDPGVVMYLIIIDQALIKYRDFLKVRPTEKFFDMVHGLVMDYVTDGEEPPVEIRSAIMNIADDMMGGREVTLRAGDYIALMNFARGNKRP